MDFLADRPQVLRRRHGLPALTGLRDWIGRETRLANPALKAEVAATGDPDLALALEWSEAVNRSIERSSRTCRRFRSCASRSRPWGQGRCDGRLGHAGRGA